MDSYSQRGVTPRSLELLFAQREALHSSGAAVVRVSISYLEIYNEQVYDLLGSGGGGGDWQAVPEQSSGPHLPRVTMLEAEDGSCTFRNLTVHVADSGEEALGLLFKGDTCRAVAETSSNAVSSRSHCVFTAYVEVRPTGTDIVRRSKLHIVDLAGSERIGKTGTSDGVLLAESKHINLSLSYLEQVIVALQEKAAGLGRSHIPYRNSCLTSVLRDSLGGNARTSMIATLSPTSSCMEEGVATCRFAQRVAMISNDVVQNEALDPDLVIKRLRQQVKDLRAELRLARSATGGDAAIDGADGVDDDIVGVDEQNRLREAAHRFVVEPHSSASVLNIGGGRLEVVRFLFSALRDIALQAVNQAERSAALHSHVAQRDAEIGALTALLLRTDAALCDAAALQSPTANDKGGCASVPMPRRIVHPLRLPPDVASTAFGPQFNDLVSAVSTDASTSTRRHMHVPSNGDARQINTLSRRAAALEALTCSVLARGESVGTLAAELRTAQHDVQRLADAANGARASIQRCDEETRKRVASRARSAVAAAMAGAAAEAAWRSELENVERNSAAELEGHKVAYRCAAAELEEVQRRMWEMNRALEDATVAANEDLAFWVSAIAADCVGRDSGDGRCLEMPPPAASRGASSAPSMRSSGSNGVDTAPVHISHSDGPIASPCATPTPPSSQHHDDAPEVVAKQAISVDSDPPELAAMLTGDADADADIRAFYAAKLRREQRR